MVDVVIDHVFDQQISNWPHMIYLGLVVGFSILYFYLSLVNRKKSEQLLVQGHIELERMVNERTKELLDTNHRLKAEILERQKVEEERQHLLVNARQSQLEAEQMAAEIKQAYTLLHESEEINRALLNANLESAMLVDSQGIVLAVNEIGAMRFNTTVDRMVGRSSYDFFSSSEIAEKRRDLLAEVIRSQQPLQFEDERDGLILNINIYPVKDIEGNIFRLAIFSRDITQRKLAEQRLRESENKYRTIFDQFPEPMTVWDRDGVMIMENLVSARNLGGAREQFLGKTVYDLFGEFAGAYMDRMQRVIDTGIPDKQEDVVDLVDGRHYFWTIMQRISTAEAGDAVQVISYDITPRIKAEQELRASEEKFATVFRFSPEIIAIIREDDTILDINEVGCELIGISHNDLVGYTWQQIKLISPDGIKEKIVEIVAQHGQLENIEVAIQSRTGEVFFLLLSLNQIKVNGEPCYLLIAHDISDRIKAEESLIQAQSKLQKELQERTASEERQRLARELHDSVSQALYGIALGAHTALTLLDTDHNKVQEALQYVIDQTQAGLTEMKALIFELRPESLANEGLVTGITKLTAALHARHDVSVDFKSCVEPAVPLEIKEAVFRITQEALRNSIKHALATKLTIKLENCADGLVLEICDDGVGFTPTGNYPGHLGLTSMHERASVVGGQLEIISTPNQGTSVKAWIPKAMRTEGIPQNEIAS